MSWLGIGGSGPLAIAALSISNKERKTMNHLTTIASLPGSGAGCMASLPAEKHEQPVKVQMKSPYFDDLDWPSIVFLDEEPGC